jgi:hypothetical protein
VTSGDVFHVINIGPEEGATNNRKNAPASGPTARGNGTGTAALPPNLFANLPITGKISVTDAWGLVIIHPDILISPTKIAESCSCTRRSVISDRVRSFGSISAPAVLGNLKHAFIEVNKSVYSDVLLFLILFFCKFLIFFIDSL